jgi:hypothetical protein
MKKNVKAKRHRGMTQVVECFPSIYKVLSSNPSAAKNKKFIYIYKDTKFEG